MMAVGAMAMILPGVVWNCWWDAWTNPVWMPRRESKEIIRK